MKNGVFWDVTSYGCCKNRRFGGPCRVHNKVERISELGTTLAVSSNRSTLLRKKKALPLLFIANVTLLMEVIRSSITLVLTRATRRQFPEDGILGGGNVHVLN
jgi:hypothetical protein